MSLSGIGSGLASSFLAGNTRDQQLSAAIKSHATGGQSVDTVSLSGPGQFLSQLQALKASDPQRFKEVLTHAATQLQTAAKQAGNSPRGQAMADLAKKFQDVANGGDISQLKPATYANRVQQAYGSHRVDGVRELLNAVGQVPATGSGADPHYVLKSALSSLNKV